MVHTLPFATGALADQAERTVLQQLRLQGLRPYLINAQVPAGGWTEAFNAKPRSPQTGYDAWRCQNRDRPTEPLPRAPAPRACFEVG